jgi:MFS family permease
MHNAPPNPPVVNWRTHLTLLLLALVYVFSYIDRTVVAILIQPIKTEFGASDTLMGFLSGLAFALLYAVMGIPLGRLADSGVSRRNMIAICCGLWSVATMACGMAAQFWQLVLARMTVAIGEAGGMAPSISMLSDLYPKSRRSLAISLYLMGPHVGLLLAMAVGGWIAQQYGWRATFLAFGIPGMVLALLLWLLVKEPRRGAFDDPPGAAAPTPAARLGMAAQVVDLLRIPAFRYVCIGNAMAGVAGYGYGIWAPTFLVRAYEMPLAHAGLIFGLASGLSAALGSVFSGWLCDRLTRRDARWQIGLPTIGVLVSVPTGIAFVLWPTADSWALGSLHIPHALVFAAAFGLFAAWSAPLSYAAVSHMMSPGQRAMGAALLNLFMTVLGAGFGPFLTGVLSDVFTARFGADGLAYALAVTVGMLGVTAVLFWMALQPYRTRLSQLSAQPA